MYARMFMDNFLCICYYFGVPGFMYGLKYTTKVFVCNKLLDYYSSKIYMNNTE